MRKRRRYPNKSRFTRSSVYESKAFRGAEIAFSVFFLLLTSPIWIIVSLAIFLSDGQPVLFRQKRLGKSGKVFKIFKFRTMRKDAEQILKQDILLYEQYIVNDFKLPVDKDPRLLRIGKFLRRWSLDEIPQFINVIIGDMHVVGPRPIVQDELERYGNDADTFLSVKPGITGMWQVAGRSDVPYPDRKYLDLLYIQHKSFKLDLTILLKTIWKVIKRDGAY
ncbi:MAG TPA: sugar transferase [Caldithrix abyssi]|uniref:Sugar transferase n=1 Tax=Caldithrix abyssi TaxID=187145 RepID=A0A7V4WTY3_CALAY|nr:sugar transferase [Caldithrix abyssi]